MNVIEVNDLVKTFGDIRAVDGISFEVGQGEFFGFLKELLVAPISRWTIVLGKVLGIATLALFQGLVMLTLALLTGVDLSVEIFLKGFPVLALLAISIASFGVAIASRVKTIQGFQFVVPLPIVLMTSLAGAIYPVRNLPISSHPFLLAT